MSRKKNRNRGRGHEDDAREIAKSMRKSKKRNRSGRRTTDKDYLKEVVTGNIDPDMFQDYIDQKQN